MPRLFSGIEIPADVSDRLAMLQGGLKGARWIDRRNFHVTLRFAGDIDDDMARRFTSALGGIKMPARFELSLDGLGSFGGRKPRMVWARIAPSPELTQLYEANEQAAQRAGLAPCSRKFTPHVTIARLRNVNPKQLAGWLQNFGDFFMSPFEVTRYVIFSAKASTGGGPYVVEEVFPLSSEQD